MRGSRRGLQALLTQVALPAAAQSSASAADPFDSSYLAQVLGSLLLVLLCLAAVIYFLRRVSRLRPGPRGQLRVLDSVGVGVREKVVLVAAGERQLLVGVAPGSVRTLHVFDEGPVDLARPEADDSRQDFSAVLRAVSPFGGARR